MATILCASDLALFTDPAWSGAARRQFSEMFRWGQEGFVDDRIADRDGWTTFDVSAITCPVTVLHGDSDVIAPVAHARHTATLVPRAELRIYENLGHFSIEAELPGCVAGLIGP